MADWDISSPDDSGIVSQFPANERAARAAVMANFGVEHHETNDANIGKHERITLLDQGTDPTIPAGQVGVYNVGGVLKTRSGGGGASAVATHDIFNTANTWSATQNMHGIYLLGASGTNEGGEIILAAAPVTTNPSAIINVYANEIRFFGGSGGIWAIDYINGGVYHSSAVGGMKGLGTINATAVYQNNDLVATQNYVNNADAAHAALLDAHGATPEGWGGRIIQRDGAGRARVVDPSAPADIATKNYVDTMVSGGISGLIPSGTRMVFHQASAPTGWTQDTSLNDRVLRVVSGAGGGVGGSWTITGLSVAGHAISQNEMPSHRHFVFKNAEIFVVGAGDASLSSGQPAASKTNTGGEADAYITGASGESDVGLSSATGGSAAHTHGISHDGSWRPLYADVIVASKN